MATQRLSIVVETDLIADVAAEVSLIQERLAKRHGDAFRVLDHRLQRLLDGELRDGCFVVRDLEPGRLIVAPGGELLELVTEARRLGVI